jgi:hemerythrin
VDFIRKTTDFFIVYADTHFKLEEAYMDEKYCPAAEVNWKEHQVMRHMLFGLNRAIDKKGASVTDVIILKLDMEKWLIHHILTVDIQLRDCH